MDNSEYEKKKARERAWYQQPSGGKQGLISRILHHPVFYEPARNSFNYVFPKQKMTGLVRNHLKGGRVDKLLIAPCGMGEDLKYLGDFAQQVYGIDLSPLAIEQCPASMSVKVGDISCSGYPENTFDLIASPLFFHHFSRYSFEPFLKEFLRVLKNGGQLVILEPSIWHPVNIITRPLKRIAGNPFGEVEDEGPFRPSLMLNSLRRVGFINVEMQSATFSHCSFYVPVAKLVNKLTEPLLKIWPFKYMGWLVIYWAEKH